MAVNNSSGTTIFLTEVSESVKSENNPLIGCYGYNSKDINSFQIPGTESYTMTFNQCQDLATDKGYQYYGIGGGIREDKIERCLGFNDIGSAQMKGISNSCKTPNGGVKSASIYSTDNAEVQGASFLIMQDDGNMCIYLGTSPSNNQNCLERFRSRSLIQLRHCPNFPNLNHLAPCRVLSTSNHAKLRQQVQR